MHEGVSVKQNEKLVDKEKWNFKYIAQGEGIEDCSYK